MKRTDEEVTALTAEPETLPYPSLLELTDSNQAPDNPAYWKSWPDIADAYRRRRRVQPGRRKR